MVSFDLKNASVAISRKGIVEAPEIHKHRNQKQGYQEKTQFFKRVVKLGPEVQARLALCWVH